MKAASGLQSEEITSTRSSAQDVLTRSLQPSVLSSKTTHSALTNRLSQDGWGGFNLIIVADVASEHILKHLLGHEKLSG